RQVSVVFQDTFLFDDTIAGNLRVARPGASDAELEAGQRLVPPDQIYLATVSTADDAIQSQAPADEILSFVEPIDMSIWQDLTPGEKWESYRRSIGADPDQQTHWIESLFVWKDYAFLETISLYQLNAFETLRIGHRLKAAKAPEWIRLAFWMKHNNRGHLGSTIDTMLYDETIEDELYTWMKRHPEQVTEDKDQKLLKHLTKKNAKQLDKIDVLPPLKPEEVFNALVAPDPDKLEMVRRAVHGIVVRGAFEEAWMNRLKALTRHKTASIRQAAYLGYSYLPARLIPMADFLQVVEDGKESKANREAALLAYSYGYDYEVYSTLYRIAHDREHAAWPAAVSRLGDIGDDYIFESYRGKKSTPEERGMLNRIEERLKQTTARTVATKVTTILRRVAWAEMQNLPTAKVMENWAVDYLREYADTPEVADVFRVILKRCKKANPTEKDVPPELTRHACGMLTKFYDPD
ncbi:MAG: hypothetical protein AAF492_05700, partial [Verrucomicrobiota bacterium]